MNRIGRVLVIALLAGFSPSICLAQDPPQNSAQAMRDLRITFLSASAASLGFKPTKAYPRVSRVVMDWPIDDTTATIVSALDGSASLYTTATFGIIGGSGHESVRFPYPAKGKIRFYFGTFQDVRVIETDAASAYSPSGRYSSLFRTGQAVLTELRKVVEARR